MSCGICYSDLTTSNLIILQCDCQFCSTCITYWTNEQIQELHFRNHELIKCPNTECKKEFQHTDLYSSLEQSQINSLNDSLFKVYSRKTVDIKACPNQECDNVGFVDKAHKKCGNDFVCEKCDASWADKEFTVQKPLKERVKGICTVELSHMMSLVYAEVFATTCPKCGISISKNGGCPHMTCKACTHEFCWYCVHDYKGHSDVMCLITILIKLILLVSFVTHFMVLLDLHTIFKPALTAAFTFLLKFVIFNGAIFLFGLLYNEGHHQYSYIKHARSLKYKFERLKGFIISELILALVFILALWHFNIFWSCISFYIWEGLGVLLTVGSNKYLGAYLRVAF